MNAIDLEQVQMSAAERDRFAAELGEARCYFELGMGGSTLMAARSGVEQIVSLDSDNTWIEAVRAHPDITPRCANGSMSLLDVAGGTGDIAIRCHKKGIPNITICDINNEMLQHGRNKAIDKGIVAGIDYVLGNGEDLPFSSNSFDCYTIAFGIRNVTHIDKVLSEAYRVLKKGGRFLCLEFSKVENPMIQRAYDFYSFSLIPKIGGVIAGNPEAYQYLSESIRKFPDQETFLGMLNRAGFEHTNYTNLSFGIAAIHGGYKL